MLLYIPIDRFVRKVWPLVDLALFMVTPFIIILICNVIIIYKIVISERRIVVLRNTGSQQSRQESIFRVSRNSITPEVDSSNTSLSTYASTSSECQMSSTSNKLKTLHIARENDAEGENVFFVKFVKLSNIEGDLKTKNSSNVERIIEERSFINQEQSNEDGQISGESVTTENLSRNEKSKVYNHSPRVYTITSFQTQDMEIKEKSDKWMCRPSFELKANATLCEDKNSSNCSRKGNNPVISLPKRRNDVDRIDEDSASSSFVNNVFNNKRIVHKKSESLSSLDINHTIPNKHTGKKDMNGTELNTRQTPDPPERFCKMSASNEMNEINQDLETTHKNKRNVSAFENKECSESNTSSNIEIGDNTLKNTESVNNKVKNTNAVGFKVNTIPANNNKKKSMVNFKATRGSARSVSSVNITLVMVTLTFLVMNLPLNIYFIWQAFRNTNSDDVTSDDVTSLQKRRVKTNMFYALASTLGYLNNALHIFLYCLTGVKFRKELVKLKDKLVACLKC